MANNDESLVKRICAGDEVSFAELVARHEHSMIAVARAYVRDPALAEEVCQETWLAVHKGIRGFKRRSSLKTWLFGILITQAKRRLAQESRQSPDSTSEIGADVSSKWLGAPAEFDVSGDWRSEPASSELNPETKFLSKEAEEQVKQAIESLPLQQRVVITLRHFEGFNSDEVANIMRITTNNQRVLLYHARKKLQERLQRYFCERRKREPAPEIEERKP